MTLTGILQRRSANAAAKRPPANTVETADASGSTISASMIRAVGYNPSIGLSSAATLSTMQFPVVRFDASSTAEYPVYADWRTAASWKRSAAPTLTFVAPSRPHAPLRLKVSVALLAIVAAGSVWAAHTKPAWLPKDVAAGPIKPAVPTTHRPGTSAPTATPSGLVLISSSPSQSVYLLPVKSYALAVSIDQPCWVIVKSVPGGATIFTRTLLPAARVTPISVSGSASIAVAARTNAIVVTNGATVLGTVPHPVVGHTYVFKAAPSR
jgi:hypothetical protein